MKLLKGDFKRSKKQLKEVIQEAVKEFSEDDLKQPTRAVVIMVLGDKENEPGVTYFTFSDDVKVSECIWMCENTKHLVFDRFNEVVEI